MKKFRTYLILVISLLGICMGNWGCSSSPLPKLPPVEIRRLILISIDGLRPEFYMDSKYPTPTLQRLARLGGSAQGVVPAYPSLTFPNHASMVTGTRTAKHGIVSNTLFTPHHLPSIEWYFDVKYLKVPTIWEVAKKRGRTVAILGWPVSVNAPADWIVPEIFFPAYPIDHGRNWNRTRQYTRPELMEELRASPIISKIKPTQSSEAYDTWMIRAASYIDGKNHPDLLLLHLRSLDEVQHATGPQSAETARAIGVLDKLIGELLEGVDYSTTLVAVTGDHGFAESRREVNPNYLFEKAGWIQSSKRKVTSWKAFAHGNGGQAAIYVSDPSFSEQVLHLLKRNAPGNFRIITKDALQKVKALPDALCALDPAHGTSFSLDLETHTFAKTLPHAVGIHGADGDQDFRLWSGLLLRGPIMVPGASLGKADIIDIAPTLAGWMGLKLHEAEGHSLFPFAQTPSDDSSDQETE